MTVDLKVGDCRDVMAAMEPESVQCVVTSPPYWGLRDYGLPALVWGGEADCKHEWSRERTARPNASGGPTEKQATNAGSYAAEYRDRATYSDFCTRCNAWRGSLGLEPTPDLYLAHMVEVFRAVRHVLRRDGTVWLVIGDCYAGSWSGNSMRPEGGQQRPGEPGFQPLDARYAPRSGVVPAGLKPKDLVMMPARLALALQADGWWVRSDIIWAKPNPMPESVTDRPASAHEHIFLLTSSARYAYDAEAVRLPYASATIDRLAQNDGNPNWNGNRDRSSTQNPQTLDIKKMMRGGPEAALKAKRGVPPRHAQYDSSTRESLDDVGRGNGRNLRNVWTIATQPYPEAHFATFPTKLVEPCILAGCPIGGIVLDPFGGSGTVGLVAERLDRDSIIIDLSEDYAAMARNRIRADLGRVETDQPETQDAGPLFMGAK